MSAPSFPITPLLPEIVATLGASTRLVLEAPPGAGKTTQVPLALLGAPWLAGRVLVLEPRRIAARAAATFMAKGLGEQPGQTVGYRMRGDARVGPATRVEVVTEAILTRMLQDDPSLDGIGAVLFDEFHERNLHSDLGLALALDAQAGLREDLRLVVMSATLDGERLARFLDAPRLTAEGRSFPVDVAHLPARPQEDLYAHAARAIDLALATTDGDVLVFLPGKGEIERLRAVLERRGTLANGVEAHPLHGELPPDAQAAALSPPGSGVRRLVLATNVAESSVTLPAVRAVVDSGLAREPRFDPQSGLSRLETVAIAQASATQRAGRAGRVGPGKCWRLWPESTRLEPAMRAEILHTELTQLALELAAWGAQGLRFVDAPPPGPLAEARERLARLALVDGDGRITRHGRDVLALGMHPRFGHAVLAVPPALRRVACDVAALVEGREPLRGDARRSDDLRERLAALDTWRDTRRAPADADRGALAQLEQQAAQHARRARTGAGAAHDPVAAGRVLALAYPDRIARHAGGTGRRYQLANGRGAALYEASKLVGEPWLVASDLRFEARDSLVQRAAPVDEAWLREVHADRFSEGTTIAFNDATRAVEAWIERRFDQIVLERRSVPVPRTADTSGALADGVARLGLGVLPWTDNLRQWQARVACLREWLPELGLPDAGDAALATSVADWLGPYLAGKTRVSAIDAELLGEALAGLLDAPQRRALTEHAPVSVTVPSGMTRRVEYAAGQPPVLAVKLQELFGLADGPRVGKGRVPVTLQLLSPAQRPIQVTQDLKGFWERTYPDVRRELKGRYPKHPWPDDPWTAVPTARAKPRSR